MIWRTQSGVASLYLSIPALVWKMKINNLVTGLATPGHLPLVSSTLEETRTRRRPKRPVKNGLKLSKQNGKKTPNQWRKRQMNLPNCWMKLQKRTKVFLDCFRMIPQAYPDILLLVLGFLHKNRQMLVRTIKMSWHTFCDYSSLLNRSPVWLQFGTLTPI